MRIHVSLRIVRIQFLTALLASACAIGLAAEPKEGAFTTKSGVAMPYVTMGESGSWVVLIPGLTDSAKRMYVDSGIMAALAKNHRVVALPDPGTWAPPDLAIELLDHLKIEKAHIYGYSQGGGYTGTLLAKFPERFITAGFGGSGIWEYDQKEHDHDMQLDQALAARSPQPPGGRGGRGGDATARGAGPRGAGPRGARGPRGGAPGVGATTGGATPTATTTDEGATATEKAWPPQVVSTARPHSRTPIDLFKVNIPILSINGSLDTPFVKTQRMFRELRDFTNVILPDLNHMTAIGVNSQFPKEHIDALVRFINSNDSKN